MVYLTPLDFVATWLQHWPEFV